MKILVEKKEVEYLAYIDGEKYQNDIFDIGRSGKIVYEFIVPYDREKKTIELTFRAKSYILAESDTCGFEPINLLHTW